MSRAIQGQEADSHRKCGKCTLCCKVLEITEIDKPAGKWCKHCRSGAGCTIYETKPTECSLFNCGYLTWMDLGPEWHPHKSKIILVSELGGSRLVAHVDSDHPNAWKREPYYSQLKYWAAQAHGSRNHVVAKIGRRVVLIWPHRDEDMGELVPK